MMWASNNKEKQLIKTAHEDATKHERAKDKALATSG